MRVFGVFKPFQFIEFKRMYYGKKCLKSVHGGGINSLNKDSVLVVSICTCEG